MVRLSEDGWQHLIKTSRHPKDMLYRLKIIWYLPEVIQSGVYVEKKVQQGKVRHSIKALVQERLLVAVFEEDQKENLSFISIIDKT